MMILNILVFILKLFKNQVNNNVYPNSHWVGTCRMGEDSGSVVDPTLRVRGVHNLRIGGTAILLLIN